MSEIKGFPALAGVVGYKYYVTTPFGDNSTHTYKKLWKNHKHHSMVLGTPLGVVEAKMAYKTQKAQGLETGWVLSSLTGYGYKVAPYNGVLPHMDKFALEDIKFPKFARPCPVLPRHGFVESRDVKNIHELEALLEETRKEDPQGEVIVMDRLSGRYSAVMTAAGVSWGLSNDGITGGKGESRTIPCPAGTFDEKLLPYLGKEMGCGEGVYVELVEDKGAVCVVQMRLGPKQPDSRIKRVLVALKVNINGIIQPKSDDLIEWDKLLKAHRSVAENRLVWLPGQTMSSHFAVQAIAQGYNVSVETECPIAQEKAAFGLPLAGETGDLAPLTKADFKTMARMFEADKTVRLWDYPRDVLLSVGTLHALPYWSNERHLLALRVRGAIIAARYGLAACLGEARHHMRNSKVPAVVPWKDLVGEDPHPGMQPSRSFVFVRAFGSDWKHGADLALKAAQDLRLDNHKPVMEHLAAGGKLTDHPCSFMGMRWEWAALRVHDLYVAIDKFCAEPCQANWGAILGHYNEIINAAHNGGYLLNKWCSPHLIDNAATAPALVFGFRNVMNLVWEDKKSGPTVAWLPMSAAPKVGGKFVEVEEGILIPSEVWASLEADGLLQMDQCKCAVCFKYLWEKIGQKAIDMAMPCFVPDDRILFMPSFAAKPQGAYENAIEAITKPVPKFEAAPPVENDDGESYCCECESLIEDGHCTNEYCTECPDYDDEAAAKEEAEHKAAMEKLNKILKEDVTAKKVKTNGNAVPKK